MAKTRRSRRRDTGSDGKPRARAPGCELPAAVPAEGRLEARGDSTPHGMRPIARTRGGHCPTCGRRPRIKVVPRALLVLGEEGLFYEEHTMTTEPQTERRLDSIPKAYEPQSVEQRLYRWWEESGYFKPAGDPDPAGRSSSACRRPTSPARCTSATRITATLEDIMIRYHRMRGEPTLWVPGEDHAGIATQTVVEKQLARRGHRSRHRPGPRGLRRARLGVGRHATSSRIQDQHRRLGASCDWTRERFTLDEGLARAVREVFVRLYEEGLVYRGERIINWCPRCIERHLRPGGRGRGHAGHALLHPLPARADRRRDRAALHHCGHHAPRDHARRYRRGRQPDRRALSPI